jgi:hypothetical protein
VQLAVRAAARSRSPSSPKLPSVRAPPTPSSRTRDPQHAAVDDDVDLQAGGASVLGGVRQCLGDDEVQAARGAAGDRPLGSKRGISRVVCSAIASHTVITRSSGRLWRSRQSRAALAPVDLEALMVGAVPLDEADVVEVVPPPIRRGPHRYAAGSPRPSAPMCGRYTNTAANAGGIRE